MEKWTYEGGSYPLDIRSPERLEVLIDSLMLLCDSLNSVRYDTGEREVLIEMLNRNCEAIEDFFDAVFGEETRREICGEERNVIKYSTAMAALLVYIGDEIALMNREGEEIRRLLGERLGGL